MLELDPEVKIVTVTEPDEDGLVDEDLEPLHVTEILVVSVEVPELVNDIESMLETVTDDEIEADAESKDVLVPHAVVVGEPLFDTLTEADTLSVPETDPLDDILTVADMLPVTVSLPEAELQEVLVPDAKGLDETLAVAEIEPVSDADFDEIIVRLPDGVLDTDTVTNKEPLEDIDAVFETLNMPDTEPVTLMEPVDETVPLADIELVSERVPLTVTVPDVDEQDDGERLDEEVTDRLFAPETETLIEPHADDDSDGEELVETVPELDRVPLTLGVEELHKVATELSEELEDGANVIDPELLVETLPRPLDDPIIDPDTLTDAVRLSLDEGDEEIEDVAVCTAVTEMELDALIDPDTLLVTNDDDETVSVIEPLEEILTLGECIVEALELEEMLTLAVSEPLLVVVPLKDGVSLPQDDAESDDEAEFETFSELEADSDDDIVIEFVTVPVSDTVLEGEFVTVRVREPNGEFEADDDELSKADEDTLAEILGLTEELEDALSCTEYDCKPLKDATKLTVGAVDCEPSGENDTDGDEL